jgi:hypothetical protein
MWAERAEKRLDRRRLLGLPVPDSRSDDRFVMYINQLADHSNEFFALANDEIWTFAMRKRLRDTDSLRDVLDDLSIHQSHHTSVG